MNNKFKISVFAITICFSQILQANTQMILPNYTSQIEPKDQILVDSETLGMEVIQDNYDDLTVRYFNKGTKKYIFSTKYNYKTQENIFLVEKNIANTTGDKYIKSYRLNDRPYDWYVDQGQTGKFSDKNCLPSTIEMAAKWIDQSSTIKAEKLRDEYHPDGEGFYESDLTEVLSDKKFDFTRFYNVSKQNLMKELDKGNLIITCLKTEGIPQKEKTDLFYQGSDVGHALVIYGYVELENGETFFLNMDPLGFGLTQNSKPIGVKRPFAEETLIKNINDFTKIVYSIKPEFIKAENKDEETTATSDKTLGLDEEAIALDSMMSYLTKDKN